MVKQVLSQLKQILVLKRTENILDKKYYIYKEEVARDQIEARLVSETAKLKDETVVLRIPKESQVQELVDLLGIGMKNNLKIIIATTDEQ